MPRSSFLGMGILVFISFTCAIQAAEKVTVDDSPGRAGEWGFRPIDESVIQVTPLPDLFGGHRKTRAAINSNARVTRISPRSHTKP